MPVRQALEHLHPADRRRRPGLADPGAADLDRHGHHRHPRRLRRRNLGNDIANQMFGNPRALVHGVGVLVALAIVPGLPKMPVLRASAAPAAASAPACCATSAKATRRAEQAETRPQRDRRSRARERPSQLLRVDPIEIEIGYGLIPLTDAEQGGNLLGRVTLIRRQMAAGPGHHPADDPRPRQRPDLPPNTLRHQAARRPGRARRGPAEPPAGDEPGPRPSRRSTASRRVEPAFGLPAIWIVAEDQERAEMLGYTVVDPTSVITTHLSEVIRRRRAVDPLAPGRPDPARPRQGGAPGPGRRAGARAAQRSATSSGCSRTCSASGSRSATW